MNNMDFLTRLRGTHGAEEPGARGIERVARNPDCLRLRALTIAGFTPASAAKILGVSPDEGQSPFALAMGQRFEKHLIENGGANLFALYRERNLLSVQESKFISVDDLSPGSSAKALRRREQETRNLLRAKLRGDPKAPNLIVKPRLLVTLVGVPHAIEPDFLVAADADPFYRVGELKSYPDRGGKTDPADIRSACRQAAVGVVGLRQALTAFDTWNPASLAVPSADLVMRVTGLFMPTLSRMAIEGEVDSIERAIGEAPTNLEELEAMLPRDATLSEAAVIGRIPNNYRPSCKEHCAMWQYCRAQALDENHPVILGDQAAEMLAPAGSITRALELMRGASPRNPAEATLAQELQAADQALRRAVSNG
ncbi:hypothetical protein [Burkholderia pseudomallei]|uniref:hypothetical protein n=1 Tax=Burkholderia pseudomallei TaxID=28450 RepID=UPI00052AA2C8|nr:hypothetical protein [Burkholderia pseudomallei]AIV50670.1 hypothetical protein Y603_1915 [Burkholderia pseudomallei MSHR1153]KGS60017.1 hypothetical protein X949_240 [Burkholderia pseudomallei MSHR5609]